MNKFAMNKIEASGILPVINLLDPSRAVPLVDAFEDAGLHAIEVTLRSDAALKSVREIVSKRPNFMVGVGTVLSIEQCLLALDAGAEFIVSPGFDEDIFTFCKERDVLYIPGCTSASELQRAVKLGIQVVKFFPSELSGGIEAIKLLSGPFPKLRFIPTGGITMENLQSYLKTPQVLACGGSFMAPKNLVELGDFKSIAALSSQAYRISLGFELAHIGINHSSEQEALNTASLFENILQMPISAKQDCFFAGTTVEIMKYKYTGTHGHIGFYTNSIQRALEWLKTKGIDIDPKYTKRDDKGITLVYLKQEIAGFAIHIIRR